MNRIGCRNARALRGALCVRFVCALHGHCMLRTHSAWCTALRSFAMRMHGARTARARCGHGRMICCRLVLWYSFRVVAFTLLRFGGAMHLAPHDSA